ncbi:hypothetical protein NLJ89_g8362 [Agrocybe chaxingu]|uniref:MYND-type domain-containing protein n=1 Tax=Agrocybe chaxingu TaxID=84603 RepID=A0A9W8MU64_9AGAR|nr:hypothetical protein NLJ89_g8362 [Agrocybe chaxingu]
MSSFLGKSVARELKKLSPTEAGLRSGPNGEDIQPRQCANICRGKKSNTKVNKQCKKDGTLLCPECESVRYCSKECQKAHHKAHQEWCRNPLRDPSWLPGWFVERREPVFMQPTDDKFRFADDDLYQYNGTLWAFGLPVDCVNLPLNEDNPSQDLKLCFADSTDIRNLVASINNLPDDYTGKLDVILQDQNSLYANRNLVILFTLLSSDLPVDDAVELAVHLWYSSALTTPMASAYYQCLERIFGSYEHYDLIQPLTVRSGELWKPKFALRGAGSLSAEVDVASLKSTLEMCLSEYTLTKARRNMTRSMHHPKRKDLVDRLMVPLEANHRIALAHFRDACILLPFAADTIEFNQPNHLLYTESANWLVRHTADPMYGWDVDKVRKTGEDLDLLPGDLYGALYFHIKDQLKTFVARSQQLNINITVVSCMSNEFPGMISNGNYGITTFDRIDVRRQADPDYVKPTLQAWGPLLNHENPHAVLIMFFHEWTTEEPTGNHDNVDSEKKAQMLIKCANTLGLDLRKVGQDGSRSPDFLYMMECIGIWHDTTPPFKKYLNDKGAHEAAASLGLKHREANRIHPPRYGLTLDFPKTDLQDITKEEIYNTFTLGSADHSMRLAEFGVLPRH